jgi:uncharacterized protein (TIGR00255 family)
MALNSMTGFARADGAEGAARWHWEIRSVNGRGLDVRSRLPSGYDALEPQLREAVGKRIVRGSLNVTLVVDQAEADVEIRLNERALGQVLAAAGRVAELTGSGPPSADAILAIRGVLEVVDRSADDTVTQRRNEAVLASLGTALDRLRTARASEGARLTSIIAQQLDVIEQTVARVEALPSRRPEAVAQRLRESVQRLLDQTGATLDSDRLHQEAVLVATRADVEEELKRLTAHVAAARDLLASSEPAGRKLDFLSQEFNREANTLCSKSNDVEMTRLGLELKAVIDQMREQVQNIE